MEVFFEAIFAAVTLLEVLFRIPGYYVLRCIYPAQEVVFESNRVILIGSLFWVLVGGIIALIIFLK